MAKASKEEWEAVMQFANQIEDYIKYRFTSDTSDEDILKLVRNAPCLLRVVFGYQVLVDNACDPALDHLDFKPELKRACDFYDAYHSEPEDYSI
jgi:hypothetical protein